jgi:hypothetical protein
MLQLHSYTALTPHCPVAPSVAPLLEHPLPAHACSAGSAGAARSASWPRTKAAPARGGGSAVKATRARAKASAHILRSPRRLEVSGHLDNHQTREDDDETPKTEIHSSPCLHSPRYPAPCRLIQKRLA